MGSHLVVLTYGMKIKIGIKQQILDKKNYPDFGEIWEGEIGSYFIAIIEDVSISLIRIIGK